MFNRQTISSLLKGRIKSYGEIINDLPLSNSQKIQLQVDFINFIKIIEKLANQHLVKNDLTNVIVIILSGVVPVMINLAPRVIGNQVDYTYINFATWLSVLLAVLNGLRQSYKFRERWQSYRQTAELLILEGQSYFALCGRYALFSNHDAAFTTFIDKVNLLRTKQINDYVNRLINIDDVEITKSVRDEVNSRLTVINAAKEKAEVYKLMNIELNAFAKSNENIAYFEIDHNRKLITIYVTDSQIVLPEKFAFKSSSLSNQSYRIEKAFSEPIIQSKLVISSGVKNKDMPNRDFGAAGCILKRRDNKNVFLTCYHVVKHSSHDWDQFKFELGHDDVIDTQNEVIGQIIDAEKSSELDTALVAFDNQVPFDDLLPGQVSITEPIFIDENNIVEFSDVFIISRTRNFKQIRGILAEVNKTVTLNYGTKLHPDKKDLTGLMIVHFVSTEKFSQDGDSGSLVFTPDGIPIGIIVGGDLIRASFVIPFTTINDRYNFKFT